MIDKKRKLIVEGSLFKALLIICIPMMFNNLVIASYNLIDTIFVSKIGEMQLAVIAFVTPLNNTLIAVSTGISIAGTGLIGQAIGSKNSERIHSIVSNLFVLSMFIGIAIASVLYFNCQWLMSSASATENIMQYGERYFQLLMLSMPLIFFNAFYRAYKQGSGDTLKLMNIQIISMVIKIALNYLLIIVQGKGISSMAITTLVGHSITTIYACYDLFLKDKSFKLNFRKFPIKLSIILSIMLVCIPVIIEKMSSSYGFVFINKYVLKYGEVVLSAYGITNRINSLFFLTLNGLGSGLAAVVSQNYGASQFDRIKKAIKYAFILGICFSIVFFGIILLLSPSFAHILSNDSTVLYNHIMNAVHAYSVSVIPWSIIQVVIGVYVGISMTRNNLIITTARMYAFRLPCIILLTTFTPLLEYSIWHGMLISNSIAAVFAIVMLSFSWKKIFTAKQSLVPSYAA